MANNNGCVYPGPPVQIVPGPQGGQSYYPQQMMVQPVYPQQQLFKERRWPAEPWGPVRADRRRERGPGRLQN